jgi:hypothetical protein
MPNKVERRVMTVTHRHQRGVRVRTGRALNRTAAVAVLACCAGTGLLAAPASAATGDVTVKPPVVKTNWYWAEKSPTVAGMPTGTLPAEAEAGANVPAGDLAVALVSSDVSPADKVAAIDLDLTTIPLQSTFSSFTLTVPLDADATQVMGAQPDLAACENIDAFADGPGAEDLAKAPPISAPSCVKGVFDPAKGYTFTLTTMANDWSFGAPAFGISLVPGTVAAGTPGYSIALKGKNGIVTSATYAAPAVAAPAAPPAVEVPPATVPQAPVPGLPQISSGVPGLTPSVPDVSVPAPQTAVTVPDPQTLAIQQAPVRVVASGFVAPSTRPTTGFWLALLLGVVLLGAAAVVFGDPLAPAPVDARRRRFAN